jgi:hypothetical protein
MFPYTVMQACAVVRNRLALPGTLHGRRSEQGRAPDSMLRATVSSWGSCQSSPQDILTKPHQINEHYDMRTA